MFVPFAENIAAKETMSVSLALNIEVKETMIVSFALYIAPKESIVVLYINQSILFKTHHFPAIFSGFYVFALLGFVK